jgi:transcriptional regulator with XRE-family HTH domain
MASRYHSIYKKLGDRIEHLRHERGMTQEALAAKANISHSYYWKIKEGRNISVKTATDIADALSVTISSLFDFDADK